MKDGQIVAHAGPLLLWAAAAFEILSGDFDDEWPVPFRNIIGGNRRDAAKLPLLVPLELDPQERRLKEVEEMQAQPLVAFGQVATEVDAQREPLRLDRSEAVLDQVLEFFGHRVRIIACERES